MLNECDLYAINRKITLQKLSSSPSLSNNMSDMSNTAHLNGTITLSSPHDHSDINFEKNAHYYRTAARFITICFNRRKKFNESLGSSD